MVMALVAGLSVSGVAMASSHKHKHDEHGKYANPEQKVEKMAEKLSLTPDQKAEILVIMKEQSAQRNKLREAMRELREQSHEKIKQVLNEEQRERFSKMREKHHDKHEHGDDD